MDKSYLSSEDAKNLSPESTSSFLNQILLVWFDSTVWKAKNKAIHKDDLWDLNAEDRYGQRHYY